MQVNGSINAQQSANFPHINNSSTLTNSNLSNIQESTASRRLVRTGGEVLLPESIRTPNESVEAAREKHGHIMISLTALTPLVIMGCHSVGSAIGNMAGNDLGNPLLNFVAQVATGVGAMAITRSGVGQVGDALVSEALSIQLTREIERTHVSNMAAITAAIGACTTTLGSSIIAGLLS